MYTKDDVYKKIAREILEEMPNLDEYVCTCGIGPTGTIHVGKAFDLLCAYFVSQELKSFGKRSNVICIIDDCIPLNVKDDKEERIPLYRSYLPYANKANDAANSPLDQLITEIQALNIDVHALIIPNGKAKL